MDEQSQSFTNRPVSSRPLPPVEAQPHMLRRFSSDVGPWHAAPTIAPNEAESAKRRLSEVEGFGGYEVDRDYSDKLLVELEEMDPKDPSEVERDLDEILRKNRKKPRGLRKGKKSDQPISIAKNNYPEDHDSPALQSSDMRRSRGQELSGVPRQESSMPAGLNRTHQNTSTSVLQSPEMGRNWPQLRPRMDTPQMYQDSDLADPSRLSRSPQSHQAQWGTPLSIPNLREWSTRESTPIRISPAGPIQKEVPVMEDVRSALLNYVWSNLTSGFGSVEFQLEWNPCHFMRRQFGDSCLAPIGSVIVLTGSSDNAEATTCRGYLLQHWPDTSPTLLKCLENYIEGTRNTEVGNEMEVSALVAGDGLRIQVKGMGKSLADIGEELAWLGTALQHSPDEGLKNSKFKLYQEQGRPRGPDIFHLSFSLSPLSNDSTSCCWHSLFSGSVVANGFPISARREQIGLEIPLELMAALTGVRHAFECEGGIILKGYSCAFVPVKRHADSIRWHYIDEDQNLRLSYKAISAQYPSRAMLSELSLNMLENTRHFVGWWGATETHLGTETANYENIDWSGSKQVSRGLNFSGATLGFQQIMTGELNFALGARDGKLHVKRKGPYQRIVQCAARSPVVLYDSGEKRAWLVPASAVILHIAKTRHFRNPYVNDGKEITFPSANPSANSHHTAEKVLLEQASFKLCTQDAIGKQDYCLQDLVRDIWSYLENLLDKNVTKEANTDAEVRGTTRDLLRGWEFMDLVDERSPFRLKETYIEKSSGGWTDLTRDIDAIVLFGYGFEELIRPRLTKGLCHLWKSVPKGRDYLAATVPMMNYLYEQAGSKLSRNYLTSTKLRWHCEGQLWERCQSKQPFSCSCNRLQQVVASKFMRLGVIKDPGPLEDDGAVIFGQVSAALASRISELLKPKSKQKGTIYSQPNLDLLSTNTFQVLGSNMSSEPKESCILSLPATDLPSEDDHLDTDTEVSPKIISTNTVQLVEKERGRSRSLKRGRSVDDATCAEQHPQQRKRRSRKNSGIEVQTEALNQSSAIGLSEEGYGTSQVEKTNGNVKNLSLRRKGKFIRQG